MKNAWLISFVLAMCLTMCLTNTGYARETRVGENAVLRPQPTTQPPVLDGVLDDPAWSTGPIVTGPFIVNHPVYGEVLPQKTEVWLTYDNKNIYFAFYCHDEQPEKIQGTMTKRDNIFNEDWIDVDLDSMGNRQTVYEHAANPLGVQGDLVRSVSSVESADPDWVWYSAGRIVADGYIVEMRIPLKSLRYRSGNNVTMNLAFYRQISHSSANASWPQVDQDKGYFNSLVPVVFAHLPSQLRLEALPAVTFGSVRERDNSKNWNKADNQLQVGMDLKYGVTSTSNLELTINPDYSQVESDQFQVLANQRYPIFFNEKRPFFMEASYLFSLAGAGDLSNMTLAVHTRQIVDPAWGAKFVGDFSKFSLSLLAAGDEWPGQTWDSGTNPHQGKNATFIVGRSQYTLGGDNFIGLLYSGREFGSDYNRVIGSDVHFRIHGKHSLAMNVLYTFSNDSQNQQKSDAGAFTAQYVFSQKPLDMRFLFENYGRDFRMDTAFYRRSGISQVAGYVIPRFYPKWNHLKSLKRISFSLQWSFLHDKFNGKNDSAVLGELRFDFDKQGFIEFQVTRESEFWVGNNYVKHRFGLAGGIQPARWLNTHANISTGDGVFYDFINPYLGRRLDFHMCLFLYLGDRLSQHFSYTYEGFRRLTDKQQVYNSNILVSRTTFQFNKHFFVRALVQYDSFFKKILTDLLGSFQLIPGTVLHIGYGGLYEKLPWETENRQGNLARSEYYLMRRSFFGKVSYRFQF